MIRLWLTVDDLARTRIAAPDPFAETLLSLLPLRAGPHPLWRRQARAHLPAALRAVAGLAPRTGQGPILDLLSVAGPAAGFEEGLDSLLGAPRPVLDAEIGFFADEYGGIPEGLRRLLDADSGAPRTLAHALRGYYDTTVAPYWPALRARLELERERAVQAIATGGFETLFAQLGPAGLRWRPPLLELRTSRRRDYRLDGRGLLLAPSAFIPEPICFHDMYSAHQHVLVYPAAPMDPTCLAAAHGPADRTLAGLLGAGRARVLAAAAGGATSTELARRAGMAVSSASEHSRVLREAGLLVTERRGGAVHHSLTDLGRRLLDRHG